MKFHDRCRRSGAVLVAVVACLAAILTFVGVVTQIALRGRRETRIHRQLLQVEYVCEAGILRASQQLQKSPGYRGEIWQPKLGADSTDTPKVEIQVESDPSNVLKTVQVIATLDSDSVSTPVRRSHSFTISNTDNPQEKP